MNWTLATTAFALALALALPPGAVTALTLRRGMLGGFASAIAIQLGSVVGDMVWAALGVVGVSFLVQSVVLRTTIGLIGVLLLLNLARGALTDAWRGAQPHELASVSAHGDFVTGALLSLSNPFQLVFWLGVGSATIAPVVTDPQWSDYAVFLAAFFIGVTLYAFGMAALVTLGRRFVTPMLFRVLNGVCGVFLIYLAINLAIEIIRN